MPYLRDGHPAADHSLAIGIIAESINQARCAGHDPRAFGVVGARTRARAPEARTRVRARS
eukprot:3630028-Pleurochrysis_carterae.AAC.1